ncbi:laccase-1 [Byssothecium circinans]|uniref:Laccase-1 n=1 Tax=Byssothecium circinans TaxID=147558 RepID=A0A6A5UG92_9PLEO|nr:laccase-1 [Byssothecium circinans]
MALLRTLFCLVAAVAAAPNPQAQTTTSSAAPSTTSSSAVSVCTGNTAANRSVWCDYSIDTNYYEEVPNTGVTVEYWLEVQNVTLIERMVLTVNGTVPGPKIEANWGDTVRINVKNALTNNGTGIHWHGIRQNYTNQQDGVPSITQCPIAPGESYTYEWRATQYGSSWYHSHWSLQAWNGVFGPMVINGPATANYDVDLDMIVLSDWTWQTADEKWDYAQKVGPPMLDNGLINGKNVWGNGGSRYENTFESGKSYRLRIVNTAIDTHYKFAIDGHSFKVIAMDFVPIVPFDATVLDITMGQRYDIVVVADQDPKDYWMRAVPQGECSSDNNSANIRAIIRYDSSSTANPTSTAYEELMNDLCDDMPLFSLVPYLSQSVVNPIADNSDLSVSVGKNDAAVFKWRVGMNSMLVQWAEPSFLSILAGNVTEPVGLLVIETAIPVPHPIHLHGHDYFVLASERDATYDSSVALNLINPPRRDVVNLPVSGYMVMAFLTDNPGAWLMHCHIGWHTSQGLALQFVERESEIPALLNQQVMTDTCSAWFDWADGLGIKEEDSGV